jgi:hypothetical protein
MLLPRTPKIFLQQYRPRLDIHSGAELQSKHAVRIAGAYVGGLTLAVPDLLPEGGEARDASLTDARNPEAAIFGIHVDLKVPQPSSPTFSATYLSVNTCEIAANVKLLDWS